MSNTATAKQISFYNGLLDTIVRLAPAGEFDPAVIAACRENYPTLTVSAASDAIERAKRTVGRLKAAPVATAKPVKPAPIMDGHYALVIDGEVKFYKVNTPTEGDWAGFTFLDAQASDDYFPIKNRDSKATILAAIAADPEAAMKLYGVELGKCGHCGRKLTSKWRKVGIGPVCVTKVSW